jgi:predicted lipid-binding transport protein (Tim44 family)
MRIQSRLLTAFAGMLLAFSLVAVDHADARRGGSFGSRGLRTFQSAPPTRTAPQPAAPVERSMTPRTDSTSAARPTNGAARPGMFSGFGGSLLRGLAIGGLIGLLLGNGFGGLAGMFGLLVQALLIGGAILLMVRFFRSRSVETPAMAGNAPGFGPTTYRDVPSPAYDSAGTQPVARLGSALGGSGASEIELSQTDLDTFESRLTEMQTAFGREDHAALRRLATPEMVSYLSEELAENAKNGLRNDVSNVHLLGADVAESWREDDRDYATASLNYESVDVMRERGNDQIVEGAVDKPTDTTEVWTFVRQRGGDWKVSAIQEV